MITRQDQYPRSFGRSMKTIIQHANQTLVPATCPQKPRYASIW